ncbi:MAG: DnaT-like ssDNA-binding domain-containing protein [Neptunomonas phycophila]
MNQSEFEALESSHLPHEARTLYVMCLRRYMDYSTGLTGKVRKVSYQMFKEQLEVRRERGSKIPDYIPTKQAIRELLAKLEKAGLIQRIPQKKRTDPMIFRCVLASTGSIRLNEEQHMNNIGATTQATTQESLVNTGPSALNSNTSSNAGTTYEEQHTSVTSVITTTSTREDLRKFPMHTEWEPSQNFHALCRRSKINPDELSVHRCLGPFISHFLAKPGQHGSQAAWDSAFVKWVARERSTSSSVPKNPQASSAQSKRSVVSAAVMDISDTDW